MVRARSKRLEKPLTPDALKECGVLDEVSAPQGGFDPNGAWTQTWRLWAVGSDTHRGIVEITRTVSDNRGTVGLHLNQYTLLVTYYAQNEIVADLECRADALASPQSWHIKSRTIDLVSGNEFESANVEEKAIVRNGTIRVRSAGGSFTREAPETFTSNWSLFDTVQRLPGERTTPLKFDLLQELDELKTGHQLRFREKTSIRYAGKTVPVTCYLQLGRALLPYRYYVDEHHRLLLIVGGSRAYILDAAARDFHDKQVKALLTSRTRRNPARR